MAGETGQVVWQAFAGVAGAGGRAADEVIREVLPESSNGLTEALAQAAQQVEALRVASLAQADAVTSNTEAVWQNTAAKGTGAAEVAGTVARVASGLLGGGLGAMPLVSGIIRLFGGGEPETPAPVVKYTPPAPVAFEATRTLEPISYGQNGLPRPAPQVTVQVQAMDSRSFLDHSEDIARAVREAMLHMDRLNDVVSEL